MTIAQINHFIYFCYRTNLVVLNEARKEEIISVDSMIDLLRADGFAAMRADAERAVEAATRMHLN
tara:strand:- start:188 stop:382 length:195 start_codon:yes stop_codon:yes gene_type:complete